MGNEARDQEDIQDPKQGGEEPVSIVDLAEEDIHSLSEEELDRLMPVETDDESTIEIGESDEEEPDDAAADDKATTGEPAAGEPATTGEEGEKAGEAPTGDPLKDTQKAFHKKAEENKRLLEENKKLQDRIKQLEEPEYPDEYTAKDLQELRVDDPDEYDRVLEKRAEWQEKKDEYDQTLSEINQSIDRTATNIAANITIGNVIDAAGKMLGIDVDPNLPFDEQPAEYQALLKSPEFKETMDTIDKNPKRFYEQDGSISAETILMVHRGLNFDKLVTARESNARVKGSENAIASIKHASDKGSKQDRVSSDHGDTRAKKFNKLTQEEIHQLSEEQLNAYLEEAELQNFE